MQVDNVACVAGHRHQKTVPVASNTDTKKQHSIAAALDIIFQMSLEIKPSLLLRCPRPNQCEMGMHNGHR